MNKFYLFWLDYLSYLKNLGLFSQMVIWYVSNILEDHNTYPIENWCTRSSKTRKDYLDLTSKLFENLFLNFNQRNVYADKIWRCNQRIQWKYSQKSLLGIFFNVTLFLNMIQNKCADKISSILNYLFVLQMWKDEIV